MKELKVMYFQKEHSKSGVGREKEKPTRRHRAELFASCFEQLGDQTI